MKAALRPLPLPAHAAVELAFGLALVALPFALGAGAAATIVAALFGAVVGALALSGFEGGGVSARSHAAYDRLITITGLLACVVLASRGDDAGAVVLGLAAMGVGILSLATRYTR